MQTVQDIVDAATQPEVVNPSTPVDPNRPATADDAATLGSTYRSLYQGQKAMRQSVKDLAEMLATNPEASVDGLIGDVELATTEYANLLKSARLTIQGLPNGTTARGGATRQTVVLQFYGNVNRDLKSRLTSAQASKVNKLSFGGN